jgi:hypothetical protein
MRPGGAPGDDVQLGAFLRDDDVVDALRKPLCAKIEACLHGEERLLSRKRTDEVPVALRLIIDE